MIILGAILGAILGFASKKFYVKEDTRGFVSYVNFIPLLISEINTLKEEIKKLKGE